VVPLSALLAVVLPLLVLLLLVVPLLLLLPVDELTDPPPEAQPVSAKMTEVQVAIAIVL
jgi:hypothetical protein